MMPEDMAFMVRGDTAGVLGSSAEGWGIYGEGASKGVYG